MNKNSLFLIGVLILAGLNIGTVRRTEDPIRDTQTNPILYEQKKEEEKDGKKGPLLYHVKNYPRETFFIDPPFEKEQKSSSQESLTEKAPSSADIGGWWEEQPTDSREAPPAEAGPESLPGSLPEDEKVQDLESAERPVALPETGDVPSVQGNDSWW